MASIPGAPLGWISVFFRQWLLYIVLSTKKLSTDCAGGYGDPQTVVTRGPLSMSEQVAPEVSQPRWSRAFLGLSGRVCRLCFGRPASLGALQMPHTA